MSTLRELLEQRIRELEDAATDRVSDADRARALERALANPQWMAPELKAFLAAKGIDIVEPPPEPHPSPPVSETPPVRLDASRRTTDRPSPPAGSHIVHHHGAISYDSLSYDPPPAPTGWWNRRAIIPALPGAPEPPPPEPRVPTLPVAWAQHEWSDVVYPSVFRRDRT